MYFWGFDLGDGESTVARINSDASATEIVEVDGNKVTLSVWAMTSSAGTLIGERAARAASSAFRSSVRFKSRFLDKDPDTSGIIRDFSGKILEMLRDSEELVTEENETEIKNCFYIGCPAGWGEKDRERYRRIFVAVGCPSPRVISESRAVMVGAVHSNYIQDHVELRSKNVLVVDIGSSTTDLAFIKKGHEEEVKAGGNVRLGGGIMDELLLEECIRISENPDELRRVFAESEAWRVDSELKLRKIKERYFSLPRSERKELSDTLMIAYDRPMLLKVRFGEETARAICEYPSSRLDGRSFREVFLDVLNNINETLGEDRPELLFLTGGVSKMDEITEWCSSVFPEAVIYKDSEPEFSVAKGLAICGKTDNELMQFRSEVDKLVASDTVEKIVSEHIDALFTATIDPLIDPMFDKVISKAIINWTKGEIDTLNDLEDVLKDSISVFLHSGYANSLLYDPVEKWMKTVSKELSKHTDEICRKYHVPIKTMDISSDLSPEDLKIFEQIKSGEVVKGNTLTGVALMMESIVAVIVATLCGGSGVALISAGPVGIIAGAVISIVVMAATALVGKKATRNKIMDMSLHKPTRQIIFGNLFPKVEMTKVDLPDPIRMIRNARGGDVSGAADTAEVVSGEGSSAEPAAGETSLIPSAEPGRARSAMLPTLRMQDKNTIPSSRSRVIKKKIRSGYDVILKDKESEEYKALHDKLTTDISDRIEKCLKDLAVRVEIPL